MFELILTPGTHAISMRGISEFATEHEILLDYDCYVLPHTKHNKLMLSEVYSNANYDKQISPTAYYNSRSVMVVTQQAAEPVAEPVAEPAAEPAVGTEHVNVEKGDMNELFSVFEYPSKGGRMKVLSQFEEKLNVRNRTVRNNKQNIASKQRFANTRKNIRKTMNRIPSNQTLPFWKVRDTSDPRISTDPIPSKERTMLDETLKKYKKHVYG
jgi:hypothetical protein